MQRQSILSYPTRLRAYVVRAILPGLILMTLAACGLQSGAPEEPPLPAIVPATATVAAQATATPPPPAAPPATPAEGVVSTAATEPEASTPTSLPAAATEEMVSVPTEAPPAIAVPATETSAPPTEPPLPATAAPLPPTPAVAEVPPFDTLTINLIPIASGFQKPLFLTHAGDGSGRLFVVEQAGRILILSNGAVNPTPFLDIVSIVGSDASEQGLLGLAFQPDYPNNGYFFINYTNKQGDTVIARYNVSDNPDVADPNSAKVLLTIDQPYANHNGGNLVFGPDGYLYIGMGDGGAANDPHNNGQNLDTLLGKILRLDVNNADPYGAPQDNPFVNTAGARPEIWSYGWRNPWRFSFDRANSDMYIADVGQNQYEEVHVELAGTPGGQNYGWRFMEGAHCFEPRDCDPASLGVVLPVAEYDHGQGCSITGGYVYRGSQFPALTGTYFYADYCSGIMWGLRREADGSWAQRELLQSGYTVSSFGEDEAGEVYLVHHQGDIFQVGN